MEEQTEKLNALIDIWDLKDRKLTPNQKGEKCSICGIGEGEIQIEFNEMTSFWLCESCDKNLNWKN